MGDLHASFMYVHFTYIQPEKKKHLYKTFLDTYTSLYILV